MANKPKIEQKHSPGPWSYLNDDDVRYIHAADSETLMCSTPYHPYIPTNEADWRLIGASPEMLALLIDLYEHGYTTSADHDRVREVITKATGKAPI